MKFDNDPDKNQLGIPLWSERYTSNDVYRWQLAQVPIGHGLINTAYKVIFEESVDNTTVATPFSVFIDDIYIRDYGCLPPGDCDFENGFCKLNKTKNCFKILIVFSV